MGNNNLYKVENTLRSMAKRYKSVKYSLGLAILFLMMGVNAFSEEVVAQEVMTNEEIASSKENLKDSVGNLRSKIDSARKENEKGLAGLKLELVQLMEQGNQVVKSPWSSWQFGANYMYDKWNGTYKGRGDKAEKYPYEGILTRSENLYERNISPLSKNYSSLPISSDLRSASSNSRDGILRGYGLVRVKEAQESIVGFDVNAGVRPKQVQKGAINIADKNPIAPEQPKAISFSAPVINVNPPAVPVITAATPTIVPPTVSVGAFANPQLPTPISFEMASPTIEVPTLTAPSVTTISPPGTGNGDDSWISDGSTFIKWSAGWMPSSSSTTSGASVVGAIAQQAMSGGKLTVTASGSNLTLNANGITFASRYGSNHNDSDLGSVLNFTATLTNYYAALKLVGGHTINIDTDIDYTGSGSPTYDRWLFHTDGHNNYGQSTWVTKKKINVNGDHLLMYTSQYHSSSAGRNIGFVNEGTITVGGDHNYVWAAMSATGTTSRTMYFDNKSTLTLGGTDNTFANIDSENAGDGFSIINGGTFSITGDRNTGIVFGKSYPKAEILLNSPITITGNNSTGVYFNHDVELEGGQSRNVSAYGNNTVTSIPGSTRESVLNTDITAGKQNVGLFFDAAGQTFDVANSTINLTGGQKNAGIFAQQGTVNLKNAAKITINLSGGTNNIGIFSNSGSGATSVDSKAAINLTGGTKGIGALSVKGPIVNKGTINVSATDNAGAVASSNNGNFENATGGKVVVNTTSAVGIAGIDNGTAKITGGDVSATGKATAATYANKGGKVNVTGGKITAGSGGINFYAANDSKTSTSGTINISGATIETDNSGLTFMADNAGTSKINITGTTTATIKPKGSVFYFQPTTVPATPSSGYVTFAATDFTNYMQSHFSGLNSLTLNMQTNSNLAVASYIETNVSDATIDLSTSFGGAGQPNVIGDYNSFLLYRSKLTIDKDSNLDSTSTGDAAAYRKLALSSSTIINNKAITATEANKIAMAQEDTTNPSVGWVKLENSATGTMNLSGDGSVGMYASNGTIKNDGSVTIGKAGVGLYGHNNGYGDTTIINNKDVSAGSQGIGMYAREYTTKGLENSATGTITLTADKGIGMLYVPKNLTASTTVENKGTITQSGTGDANIGIYADYDAASATYTTKNSGTINLGDSTSLSNPTIGMYTKAPSTGKIALENTDKITVGKYGIGMYGFEETTTGDITVGDGGIALYSQGGAVNIGSTGKNITVKVGASKATAVFTTGNGQTVTSTNTTYDIGNNSYGFVNTGTGNTINITGGKATLVDNGVFIYSKTGTITSTAPITATGTTGSNYAIYAGGTVTNSGNITMTGGTGNVGIYATNNGTITNSGDIKLGASTQTKRSIGAIANIGTINNNGDITVNGAYGLGIYATGAASTVTNTKNITLTGDEVIGAFGTNSSNINLTSGTVSLTGNKSTGYYLNGGTASSILSPTKINITGNESNGVYVNNGASLTYSGDTKVVGDAAYGLIVDNTSTVNTTGGTLTVSGTGTNPSKTNANRGSAALVVTKNSTLGGGKLDVTANVSGKNSVGIYSAGNLTIDSANISAYDSAVNFYTNGGTISIGNNGGTSTVVTGTGATQGALLFYTPTGRVLLNGPVNATVEGSSDTIKRGTAFYYTGTGTLGNIASYTQFNPTNVAFWGRNIYGSGGVSTLGKLNLTMNKDSRLFLTERVNIDLSNTSVTNLFSGLSASERPTITSSGGDYRTFMLYHSHLNVDKSVNLDNASDGYNLMEISSSSITNNNTMVGSKAGQIAIAQENDTAIRSVVTLTNNGTINLSGSNTAGIYGKNAIINNKSKIAVGKASSGIYGLNNTLITNSSTASITTGASSTGIYYSDIEKDSKGNITKINTTTTSLTNDGAITLNGDDSVGLTYEPGNISGTVTFRNTTSAKITSTGDKNVGMFAKVSKNGRLYNTINEGEISLGNSASLNNPNIGMYTNAATIGKNPLLNTGKIKVGDYSVAMYGFEESTTNGEITVGNGAIGLYSKGGNISIANNKFTTGSAKESVAVYTVGNNQTITNSGSTFNLGDTSFGFVNVGTGNNITSTGGTATLSNEGVFIYSSDKANTITNSTKITSTGSTGRNYGIYASGRVNNSANIDFGTGAGNLGIYVINGGRARSTGTITVGASDKTNQLYGVGMAAGYIGDKTTAPTIGTIENAGIIRVNGEYSIGMYGAGNGTVVTNNKDIILNASNTTGIYVEKGAKAINNGKIVTGTSGLSKVNGVVLGENSVLDNYGIINVAGTQSNGVLLKGGIINNRGTIIATGIGSKEENTLNANPTSKWLGNVLINAPAGATTATITRNGVTVTPVVVNTVARNPITVSASSIGLYVNTSGKDYTNPIIGLGNLTSQADLIIGVEAAASTTSRNILVNDSKILDPYNNAILSSGVSKWDVYSSSLTWITSPTLDKATGKVTNLYMAKVPYTEWAKDRDTYNFTDGLEQRYGVEALGTRENRVFQKLNSIGNNEEILLYQAYDEMMGHQYANVQQRVQATNNILDKEFNYLRSEWQTASKDSNKIKIFGAKGEYKTDTAGVIDYKYNAQGVAYVHGNEDIKLGRGIGWYTGIVNNTIKFKDIGNSKEEQLQAKVGMYKSIPFDDNNSLNWTISGEFFAGYNKLNRKFLVVDEVFSAKSKYYNYGVGIKNEIGKEFRLSESFSLRPYAALGLEYGRVSKIRERSGEIKLEVKQNDYVSVKPEVGTELAFKQYFGRKTVKLALGAAYENELGRVANGKNKARVADTSADWFNIRGEKEDRRGNVKFDLNLGLDNQRFGVTGNVGYDTKGQNVRGGVGLRVIF